MPGIDIHVGIWLALEEAGIVPTECSGTSAGAIISAFQAAGYNSDSATHIVRGLRDDDIRHERVLWLLRTLQFLHCLRPESIMLPDRISAWLQEYLPDSWDRMKLPLKVWATCLRDKSATNVALPTIASKPWKAVLASMSIPGFFPRVHLDDGEQYLDGGMRFNLPLPSNWHGYDEVWLLIATARPSDYPKKPSILTDLVWALHVMQEASVIEPLQQTSGADNVHIIWPDLKTPAGALHFDHELIMPAYEQAKKQLAAAGFPETGPCR